MYSEHGLLALMRPELVIGGLVFFLVIVPVLISVFVRKKKSRTLVATPAENTVEESRHDESPYSLDPIEESEDFDSWAGQFLSDQEVEQLHEKYGSGPEY
jgi:hypothetical protein